MRGLGRILGRAGRGARGSVVGALGMLAAMLLNGGGAIAAPADGPSYIVVEAASGDVLASHEEEAPRYPASLTKMMTLYMTFEALRDRRIGLGQLVPVSLHAASMVPTKLGLLPRTRITVRECILGMLTRSANDAASAMGELLGGTEPGFAQMMTLRAHALGMRDTFFSNASGLPDPRQVTTARDMALLARHLIADFPEDYGYFGTTSFVFHGQTIYGHDPLLATYPGADGMKTGFTNAAGYNLATSAVREGKRLIGIVLGAPSQRAAQRDDGEPARPVLRAGWRGQWSGERFRPADRDGEGGGDDAADGAARDRGARRRDPAAREPGTARGGRARRSATARPGPCSRGTKRAGMPARTRRRRGTRMWCGPRPPSAAPRPGAPVMRVEERAGSAVA